jgi:hypothetical protein
MAIFSLNHSFIGRSKHPPGAASLYERYITRADSCTVILGARMPTDGTTRQWLDAQEQGDRKNARVIDKLIVALPIELSRDQQIELLEAFGERMTQGRASWMAAIHASERDADNPHAHMIFRDRDVDTGRRVMMTTEAGSTERFRQGWEEEVNFALERAGREERVDRRSLADQGIEREAQIHVGAGAQALAAKQHEFQSAEKETTRLIHGVPSAVTINYPVIDEGKTRFEENEERKARNAEREAAMEGPHRPDGAHPSMQAIVDAAARAEALYKRALAKPGDALDDSDPIAFAIVREQLADFYAVQRDRDPDPRWGPFEWDHGQQSRPENTWTPRRGPYPSGPGKPPSEPPRRYFVDPDRPRGPPGTEPVVSDRNETERAPKNDATALIAGAGLSLFSRIADSLWSFFEGPPSGPAAQKDERDMTQENKTRQQVAQERSAEQQRREAEEAAHWRKVEMETYLNQRDRERHHDRGR